MPASEKPHRNPHEGKKYASDVTREYYLSEVFRNPRKVGLKMDFRDEIKADVAMAGGDGGARLAKNMADLKRIGKKIGTATKSASRILQQVDSIEVRVEQAKPDVYEYRLLEVGVVLNDMENDVALKIDRPFRIELDWKKRKEARSLLIPYDRDNLTLIPKMSERIGAGMQSKFKPNFVMIPGEVKFRPLSRPGYGVEVAFTLVDWDKADQIQ